MRNVHTIDLLPDEHWWGGVVHDGTEMPFGATPYQRDLAAGLAGNQGVPLLLSSQGRYVWCDQPFHFSFDEQLLRVAAPTELVYSADARTLRGAFQHAAQRHFPPSGRMPDPRLFSAPQYNTWIEMLYAPTQAKVLAYAEALLAQGFPPGVLMIDDNWQEDYGVWRFHPGRFPDPHALVENLHALGFTVMLWVCPFVSPDSSTFRALQRQGYLVRTERGEPALRSWWNGYSAVLDGSNAAATAWMHAQLHALMETYGVDGFKFDAGDPEFYLPSDHTARPTTPWEQCWAWAELGLQYPLNEYRACWKQGGQALGQRLRDKAQRWDGTNGLAALVPNGVAQGLAGYAFSCPDMIGGGEGGDVVDPQFRVDQEFFVRYAQCAALFPMMQFSTAPWRVLDAEHVACCVAAAHLHTALGPEIVALAEHAAQTGEPILRHLAYVFPHAGYEQISDQFLLGDTLLVAPVLVQGAQERTIVFPPGTWRGDDGSIVQGPTTVTVAAPLSRLPWYRRQERVVP
jgi:alpha-glucosidase (family GH31 glycosyl hydrolase)